MFSASDWTVDNMQTYPPCRIIADLRACTGPSSYRRGVGNLSLFWFSEMLRCRGDRELFALVEAENKDKIRLPGLPGNRRILFPALPEWSSERDRRGDEADTLSAIAYSAFLAPWNADVVHVAHAFEDFAENAAGLPHYTLHPRSQVVAATVYDFIPLVFPDFYFRNYDFRRFYLSRLQWLRHADVLTAISESTRNDAVNLAGLDPERIIVIPPYIDSSKFKPVELDEVGREIFLQRYGIRNNFVLYVGGDEYRKNIDGALRAFAMLPTGLREAHQLVLACEVETSRREELHRKAVTLGLGADDLRITGFVPDADLPLLYALCGLFVFPSLYEGLGLPLLEAMACGAPVIGGDNSSQRKIIGRADAVFNARDDAAIAETMHKALTDEYFRKDLRTYGLRRSRELTCDGAGETIITAFEDALERKRGAATRCVRAGCLPRGRLAYFSPIPPDRSGIAAYSALMLPYLAEYFDIDIYTTCAQPDCPELNAAFRIYAASDFLGAAGAYDYILYEFGNSDFHAHMFELLERFPGVVTLHDAYLSGILHWMGRDIFVREALYSHGPLARRILLPSRDVENADYEAVMQLPCTRRVLEQAVGVISHSRWNLALAHKFYPEGLPSPYRIIPQAAVSVEPLHAEEKAAIKKRLGFAGNAFIMASFGHIAATKLGSLLLDAFTGSDRLMHDPDVNLVFVGAAVDDDAYGKEFMSLAASVGIAGKVKVTGYVGDAEYAEYLAVAEMAVQLRRDSRGELSRGALDALAYGVPLLVNNYASYAVDYPDKALFRLSEQPDVNEVRAGMEKLYSDAELRSELSRKGRKFVRQNNDPRTCAALYAAAIHEFYACRQTADTNRTLAGFARSLGGDADSEDIRKAGARLAACDPKPFKRRKLLVDVGYTAATNPKTGVSRVVREIVKNLYSLDLAGIDPIAVELKDGELLEARSWLEELGVLLPEEQDRPAAPVRFAGGDILLMLDSSWARYDEYLPAFEALKKAGGEVAGVVYDLLPLTLPPADVVPGGREWFAGWLRKALERSDRVLGISASVLNDLCTWQETAQCAARPTLHWWHLGADFPDDGPAGVEKPAGREPARPFLLLVGTIEPRKNHALVLDAFAELWSQGCELSLCVAGNEGWLVEALMPRLRECAAREPRMVFVENPSDGELTSLYRNAAGLLFPSKGEGFGLPLVEAAHYGTPVLCSDIPVFHEIAGEHAFYLDISSAGALAEGIRQWLRLSKKGRAPDSSRIAVLTWEESAKQLLAALDLGAQG